MNLIQLKQRFAGLSGRYDLLNEDPSETIDFFINSGSEYLDRLSTIQKSFAVHYRYLVQGAWNIQFPYCRAVKEVWVSDTTERWQLVKMDLQTLLFELMSEKVSGLTQGDSLYYAPMLTRVVGTPPVGIANYIDTIVSQGNLYNAILILPPPDIQLLVEIKGLFNSTVLVNDTDENFWSAVHPSLLLKASLHELEIFNQNADKVAAWEKAITIDLDGINKDMVEEDTAEISEMDGESRYIDDGGYL
jgi:hypothetical protein